jgi:hypothetical protein
MSQVVQTSKYKYMYDTEKRDACMQCIFMQQSHVAKHIVDVVQIIPQSVVSSRMYMYHSIQREQCIVCSKPFNLYLAIYCCALFVVCFDDLCVQHCYWYELSVASSMRLVEL